MNNNKTPLVSIVLITYNSSGYVLETLESVKAQTWRNIELIVSDDGSTDHTIELCSDWLDKNRGHFYNAELITVPHNTGIPSNCNRGLRAAKGDWVKTISGDDILLENCISDNLTYADLFSDASFIISDVQEIDEKGEFLRTVTTSEGVKYFAGISSSKKQLKAYIRWPVFLNVPTFFCKRDVIERIGFCDEEFSIYEDTTMVIRMMEKGIKLYYMEKPTVAYRIHQNSVSRSDKMNDRREKEAYRIFLKYRAKHLNIFNPLDLSVYYECWLRFKYKGSYGFKGDTFLRKLSFFYWYMKLNGVKSY
ncbi:MAG: glycosyltransferase [Fermentimonas sp.]|nr:glycosyltransferase [Fermentimonas sp.]